MADDPEDYLDDPMNACMYREHCRRWRDAAYESGIELAEATSPARCRWTEDTDGFWRGSCGIAWEFIDGGPEDNGCHFCPRCGGSVTQDSGESDG